MKRIYTLFCLCTLFPCFYTEAQVSKAPVLSMAEKMPEYPGGLDSLIKEITQRIVYPQVCLDSNIEGKVGLRFVVNEDGTISDIVAGNGPHPALKAAAIEAAKGIGKFTPAVENGTPVKVYYSVPVVLKIKKEPAIMSSDTRPAEHGPEFPGGDAALISWIKQHIKYPAKDEFLGTKGKVLVRCVITKVGAVEDVVIVKGINERLDKEAVRVISSLPRFRPAVQNGSPVSTYLNLPVIF